MSWDVINIYNKNITTQTNTERERESLDSLIRWKERKSERRKLWNIERKNKNKIIKCKI